MKKYTKSIRKQMRRSERRRVSREKEKEKTRLYFEAHPEMIPVKRDLTKRNRRGEEVDSLLPGGGSILPAEGVNGIVQTENITNIPVENVLKEGSFAYEVELIRRENEAKLKILTGETPSQVSKPGGKER